MPKRADASPATCANCKCPVGSDTGEWPVTLSDDAGDGKGKRESFCAQCFIFVRAVAEPDRWHWWGMRACQCERCSLKQVDFGAGRCFGCKAPLPKMLLGPKIAGTQVASAEVRLRT